MPFTIGLGRNSPIPLEGDPKKYEGLIVRHGQYVRWMAARKCSCLLENNRVNPRCTKCRGTGWRYSFQNEEEDLAVEAQIVDASTVEMPYEVEAGKVSLIQDGAGVAYSLAGVYGKYLRVVGAPFGGRGLIYVSVRKPRIAVLSKAAGIYQGHGLIKMQALQYENPWTRVPIDLLSVDSVVRSSGVALSVSEYAVDKILIDTAVAEPSVGETVLVTGTYMPPCRVAVINQIQNEVEFRALQEAGGDALALFPYAYKVAEQDIITSWAATQVRKKILKKSSGAVDILPDLFVSQVLHLEDLNREYVEGVDFIVWDRNTVRWIVDENIRPAVNANFSIEYQANATYRVVNQFPNIRSSENKRFPQRVAVKLETGTTGGDQI